MCYIYPPEVQASGVMTRELAQHLADEGHEATVITGFPNHPHGVVFEGYRKRLREWEQQEPFGVLRVWHTTSPSRATLPRMAFYISFALSSLVHGLLAGRQDIVVSLSAPVVGGLACLALARLRRAKFVYGVWDVYPEAAISLGVLRPGRLANLLRRIDTWVCRRADRVVVLSEGFKRLLTERGLDPDTIEVLPIWLDADEIQPLPRTNTWRAEHEIDEGKFIVLYAGTIGLISGAQFVADAARMLQDDEDILFLFVGEGLVRDEIAERVKQMGLRNVRFLPFQPRARLAEVQASADVSLVTLLPGQGATSMPSKMLGYMAAARPVLASVESDSNTAACIEAGHCGLVLPPQDPGALAEAIRALKSDRERRERMGQNGRDYLLRTYSKDVTIERYVSLFRRLLEQEAGDDTSTTIGG